MAAAHGLWQLLGFCIEEGRMKPPWQATTNWQCEGPGTSGCNRQWRRWGLLKQLARMCVGIAAISQSTPSISCLQFLKMNSDVLVGSARHYQATLKPNSAPFNVLPGIYFCVLQLGFLVSGPEVPGCVECRQRVEAGSVGFVSSSPKQCCGDGDSSPNRCLDASRTLVLL